MSELAIRVGIVDDNRSVLSSLQRCIDYTEDMRVVMTATDGNSFLRDLKSMDSDEIPDVVIMDINMPGPSGIDVVRHGRALYAQMRFLMLTASEDDDSVFQAIQAGAHGYLLKDEDLSQIVNHLRKLAKEGTVPMTPRIARKTLALLGRARQPGTKEQSALKHLNLSSREQEVLNLLVEGKDYRAIAHDLNISPHTVRKHIANSYEKLHVSSKTQVIKLMQSRPVSNPEEEVTCRIVLTDDHQIILDSLGMMISTIPGMRVVAKFVDSRQVIPYLKSNPADMLITDLNMPLLGGLDLIEAIRREGLDLPILVLTVSDDSTDIKQSELIGADGYVLKKTGKRELTNAIKALMRGETYHPVSETA